MVPFKHGHEWRWQSFPVACWSSLGRWGQLNKIWHAALKTAVVVMPEGPGYVVNAQASHSMRLVNFKGTKCRVQ